VSTCFLSKLFPSALLVVSFLVFSPFSLFAQKSELRPSPPLSQAEGEKQARLLLNNLLSQRPTQNYTNTQVVRIRHPDGKREEIPVRFEILCSPTNYSNIYEVINPATTSVTTRLTIIHPDPGPNEYWLEQFSDPGTTNSGPRKLSAAELSLPFAGSDFWIGDLGLEFLHWPQQRVLRKEMRKSVFCDLLQSIDPNPSPGGYTRVETWIGANRPDETVIVHADAFDSHKDKLKEFDPKKVEKINGAYQLEEMEMRNLQTRSHTWIEFNLEK
jgi:hypothetical protein